MEFAAVALLLGHTDPLGLLATHPDDLPYLNAILARAQSIRREQDLARSDYLAGKTAKHTVEGFSRVMRRVVKALASRG